MTKDDSIIETPKDSTLEINLYRLTYETFVPNIFSNNRSQFVQNFHTPTNLQSSFPKIPSQSKGSKFKTSDSHQFYDNIIKYVMSDNSFRDSQNFKAKHLHEKASMLAASALANSTKGNYGKARARYLDFFDKMGLDPMEASGRDIATWLVYRSEQTSSQNMREADLKAVKCFRHHANKPLSDLPLVYSVLKGLLKNIKAKEVNCLGFEP